MGVVVAHVEDSGAGTQVIHSCFCGSQAVRIHLPIPGSCPGQIPLLRNAARTSEHLESHGTFSLVPPCWPEDGLFWQCSSTCHNSLLPPQRYTCSIAMMLKAVTELRCWIVAKADLLASCGMYSTESRLCGRAHAELKGLSRCLNSIVCTHCLSRYNTCNEGSPARAEACEACSA